MSETDISSDPTLQPSATPEQWREQGWASESIPVRVAAKLATTLSIRFDPDSALLLRRATRLTGLTKSEFVRRATVEAARQVIERDPVPPVVITRLQEQSRTPSTGSTGPAHRAVPTDSGTQDAMPGQRRSSSAKQETMTTP